MFLSSQDIVDLIGWRRRLHSRPELSGEESGTAQEVRAFLAPTGPDRVVSGLGGDGVAVIHQGAGPGPTVMFRAELDALPIEELSGAPYRSQVAGKAHLCGHDGHMTILAALGRGFGRERPKSGRIVLLFQPAEENGAGAAAVIADTQFCGARSRLRLRPAQRPRHSARGGGAQRGHRQLRVTRHARRTHRRDGPRLETGDRYLSHAGRLQPDARAHRAGFRRRIVGRLFAGDRDARDDGRAGLRHRSGPGGDLGDPADHVRCAKMGDLWERAEALVCDAAGGAGLGIATSYHDVFGHCENNREAVERLRDALDAEGVPHQPGEPVRGSEDFGRFGAVAKSAMFLLGAGVALPSLHRPDYDFPDELIAGGAQVFMRTARDLLG